MSFNDIGRFVIILVMIMCAAACVIRALDIWIDAIKEKRRIERIKLKLEIAEKTGKLSEWKEEALDDPKNDPSNRREVHLGELPRNPDGSCGCGNRDNSCPYG